MVQLLRFFCFHDGALSMFYSYNTSDRWKEEDWITVWKAETFFYGFLKELALDDNINRVTFTRYVWRLWRRESQIQTFGNVIKLIRLFLILLQGVRYVSGIDDIRKFDLCFKRSLLSECIKNSPVFRSKLKAQYVEQRREC